MKRYVFGPVPSRRLGYSLGVDVVPWKYCDFDCIYCQVGRTTRKELERRSFYPREQILEEILDSLEEETSIDFLTFSGSGEPTLNSDLGWLIREVKKSSQIPVAVITNGSLLKREDVQYDLMQADVVLPSLDAASEDIFRFINRPHVSIELEDLIEGLKAFTKNYKGKVWLEFMVVKHINDDPEELEKYKDILKELEIDKVQLNTVIRPPAEEGVEGLKEEELKRVKEILGEKCEIICSFEKAIPLEEGENFEERIVEIVKRRPLTLDEICAITGIPIRQAKNHLRILEGKGILRSFHLENSVYYVYEQKP